MIKRRRYEQSDILLEDHLAAEAVRLRDEAMTMRPGATRDIALRKTRQAEVGAHTSEWPRSPGLQGLKVSQKQALAIPIANVDVSMQSGLIVLDLAGDAVAVTVAQSLALKTGRCVTVRDENGVMINAIPAASKN